MSPGTYQTALANHDPGFKVATCLIHLNWPYTYLCIGFYFIMFLITPQLFLSCDNLLHLFTAVEVLAGLGAVLCLLLLLGDRLHNLQEQLQPFLVAYEALSISPNNRERFSNENRSSIAGEEQFHFGTRVRQKVPKLGRLALCLQKLYSADTVVDTQLNILLCHVQLNCSLKQRHSSSFVLTHSSFFDFYYLTCRPLVSTIHPLSTASAETSY